MKVEEESGDGVELDEWDSLSAYCIPRSAIGLCDSVAQLT